MWKASGFPAKSPHFSFSLPQRRLEGAAFQTALRRLVNVQAPRKGEAFPHSGAAEPLVSTQPVERNLDKPTACCAPSLLTGLIACCSADPDTSGLNYSTNF
jgi:hypothetical protein